MSTTQHGASHVHDLIPRIPFQVLAGPNERFIGCRYLQEIGHVERFMVRLNILFLFLFPIRSLETIELRFWAGPSKMTWLENIFMLII